MTSTKKLTKAQLFEITRWPEHGTPTVSQKPRVTVQFNPASLKVSYSNQVQPNAAGTNSSIQSVGNGDSKLAVELLFDVSGVDATDSKDVRQMTKEIAYFIKTTPAPARGSRSRTTGEQAQQKYRIPGVRFQWGTFIFDGIVVSMDETLDLWSENGQPLRATVVLSLSQPGIHFQFDENAQATPPPKTGDGNVPAGTNPLVPVREGATLQGIVANADMKDDWKAIAALNGIENPRNLTPGTLVNFKLGANVSAGARVNTRISGGASANLQAGGGLNA